MRHQIPDNGSHLLESLLNPFEMASEMAHSRAGTTIWRLAFTNCLYLPDATFFAMYMIKVRSVSLALLKAR